MISFIHLYSVTRFVYHIIMYMYTGLEKKNVEYFLTHPFECVLGSQKNPLIEMVLLSTHNIYFG